MYSIYLCIPRKYVWLVSFLYYLCEIRSRNLFTGNLNPRSDNCRPLFTSWNFPLNSEKRDKILDFSLNSMLIFIWNNSNAFCIPKHFVQNNSNSKLNHTDLIHMFCPPKYRLKGKGFCTQAQVNNKLQYLVYVSF